MVSTRRARRRWAMNWPKCLKRLDGPSSAPRLMAFTGPAASATSAAQTPLKATMRMLLIILLCASGCCFHLDRAATGSISAPFSTSAPIRRSRQAKRKRRRMLCCSSTGCFCCARNWQTIGSIVSSWMYLLKLLWSAPWHAINGSSARLRPFGHATLSATFLHSVSICKQPGPKNTLMPSSRTTTGCTHA